MCIWPDFAESDFLIFVSYIHKVVVVLKGNYFFDVNMKRGELTV